jgi:hypothetical protein
MFAARLHIGTPRPLAIRRLLAGCAADFSPHTGNFLRSTAFCGLLALGIPSTSAAQAGSIQVSARVLPATTAWTGLSEAGVAAREAVQMPWGRPLLRHAGLVQTRAEIHRSGGSHLVLVTIQYPHN